MKYTSIKSVLYSLSTLIDEEHWNENYFLEWAVRGARKLNLVHSYMDKVCELEISEHSTTLPADCHRITMIAVYNNTSAFKSNTALLNDLLNLLPTNSAYKYMTVTSLPERLVGITNSYSYVPMYKSTSPFVKSNNCTQVLPDANCRYEYVENPDGTLYTSIVSGHAVLAYKSYANHAGECLIPDHEDVKEAIESYVLARYFESRTLSMGDNTKYYMDMRSYYNEKFGRLAMKCKSLNLPDIGDLENIGNQTTRLKPQSHQFDKLFSSLGYKESMSSGGLSGYATY